ncbi:MAG: ABC transporter permease [Dehalococcoidia bacterium]
MSRYLVRRALSIVPMMFVLSAVVFLLLRLLPGNVLDALAEQNPSITPDQRAALEREYGLGGSWAGQYVRWVGGMVRGDFGASFVSHEPVSRELARRAPVTVELAVLALLFAGIFAIALGVVAAVYVDTVIDHIARSIAVLGLAVPAFWWGTVAIVYPSVWWGVSPSLRYIPLTTDPIGNFKQFAVPALILGAVASASVARMTRSMMLEVLRADYVRTARAKGLADRSVILRHALSNALLPVVTILGLLAAGLISGAVVIESIFQLRGLGLYVFDAIGKRDYPVIQSTTFVLSAVIMLINLVVDVSYGVLDPRVKAKQ